MKSSETGDQHLSCVYCGQPVSTQDHVPPKCLFPEPRPSLITVPACYSCNNGLSQDDEYFRTVLVSELRVSEHAEAQKLRPTIKRSLQRPKAQGFRISMLKILKKIPLMTVGGLYYEEGIAMKVDGSRISRVLERVTKGLFYHHFNRPLPTDYSISVHSSDTMEKTPKAMNAVLRTINFIKGSPKYSIGDEVFSYSFAVCQDEPNATFWVLGFFNTKPFWVFTMPQEKPSE
ncbi:MAG: hypothetical protein GKS05_03165 [Nitrospirales bacterium]|nr:hypothetical protein [Nitrospirales bacterium]